jgi:hypothetical protein
MTDEYFRVSNISKKKKGADLGKSPKPKQDTSNSK